MNGVVVGGTNGPAGGPKVGGGARISGEKTPGCRLEPGAGAWVGAGMTPGCGSKPGGGRRAGGFRPKPGDLATGDGPKIPWGARARSGRNPGEGVKTDGDWCRGRPG